MFGTNDLRAEPAGVVAVDAAGDYVWNLWRPYQCCRRRGQWFLFDINWMPTRHEETCQPIGVAPHSLPCSIAKVSFAHAAKGPTEDGLWYYAIGGAEPVAGPANPAVVSVTLGGSAQLGAGYSCGKFDPVRAVTHTLNDIKRGADDMMSAMTTAATSAIAALPALVLQRANPGLYDLFQNALLKAEQTLQLATKSCEQMEADIAQGKNPYADLITLSKGNDWKRQMGVRRNDVVTAKQSGRDRERGDNGVPIGGPAGGTGQPVLRFTGDIVRAGYNINLNRPITATAACRRRRPTRSLRSGARPSRHATGWSTWSARTSSPPAIPAARTAFPEPDCCRNSMVNRRQSRRRSRTS